MNLRVALTLLVRDEIDIVATMLDYHLAEGLAPIIVTDNGSVDGTLDVLRDYQRCGAIHLFSEPASDFSQHRWVTRMARLAFAEYGATWVVNADTDEFFLWREGRLCDALATVSDDVDRLFARRHDFVPIERPGARPAPFEMIHRKAVSLNVAGAPLPPKVIHRGERDVVISQGNHDAEAPTFRGAPIFGPIEVMHYPIRSLTQFESKVRNGGSGYASNRELSPATGFHKRRWYDLLESGQLPAEYRRVHFFDRERLDRALADASVIEDLAIASRLSRLSGAPS